MWALAALAVSLLTSGPPQETPVTLTLGTPLTAEIAADLPAVADADPEQRFGGGGVRRQSFALSVPEPDEYAIELESTDFDPWLVVRDAKGTVLAESTGTRARPAIVVVRLDAAATAHVDAAALRGGVGGLVLRCGRATAASRDRVVLAALWHQLEEAERRDGRDAESVAAAALRLAAALEAQQRYEDGLALAQRGHAILARVLGAEHERTAAAAVQVAAQLAGLGRAADAEVLLRSALAVQHRALGDEHADLQETLSRLGAVLVNRGRPAEAEQVWRRALAIAERVHGPDDAETAVCHNDLAVALQKLGRNVEAEPHARRALAILERVHGSMHADVAMGLNNLATLLERQRRHAEAEPLHRRALAIVESVLGPSHPNVAMSLNNLAACLKVLGRFDESEALHRRALAIREKALGPDHPLVFNSLNNLGTLLCDVQKYEEAEQLLRRVLAWRQRTLPPEDPRIAISLVNLAWLLSETGRYAEAEPLVRRSLALGTEDPDVAGCLDLSIHLAGGLGRPTDAWTLAERYCEHSLAHTVRELCLASADDRYRLSAGVADVLDHLVSTVAALGARENEVNAAWRQITAWKGVVFRLARHVARRPSEADEITALRERLRTLTDELTRARQARGGGRSLEQLLAERRDAQQDLMARLRVATDSEHTDARELGRLLPARSALLDFYVHRPLSFARTHEGIVVEPQRRDPMRMLCFVVRSRAEAPVMLDLGPLDELRGAIDFWLGRIVDTGNSEPPAGGSESGNRVRALLWDPIAHYLEGIDLVFTCTDDVITQVPFGAIEIAPGGFAVETIAFVGVQDPVTLRDQLRAEPPHRIDAPSLLAVGDVDYGVRADAPAGASVAMQRGGFEHTWPPLPFTGLEIDAVARLHAESGGGRATVLRGSAATEEALAVVSPDHTVIHFATHGWFERTSVASLWELAMSHARAAEEPRGRTNDDRFEIAKATEPPGVLAGLVLAGANTPQTGRADGLLTADEVTNLDLRGCELAVLSACETELGSYRSGEGLLGLRRAFAEAGVRTTISTLWRVRDETSRALIERFYRGLWQERLPTAQALRAAQLWMLRSENVDYRRLRHWAAFVVAGDWR